MGRISVEIAVSSVLAFLLYWNTLSADFAYDDSRAILKNQDLLPETALSNVFYNDFWGTPLTHSGSHKSYRPVCVLTYRLNYWFGKLEPFGYHLGNVMCHVVVTALYTYTIKKLTKRPLTAAIAGLMFASHPIHTEAVAGVVGRADILACLFFLGAFLCYQRYCKYRDKPPPGGGCQYYWLLWAAVLTALSMLSKEQGVTVLAVCATYDMFVQNQVTLRNISYIHKKFPGLLHGLCSLLLIGLVLIIIRVTLMGSTPPEFAPADNPASDSESFITRSLTYLYLPYLNFMLLVYPRTLSFDWSMESVPLISTVTDLRNISTVAFYSIILYFVTYILKHISAPPQIQKTVANGNGCTHHVITSNSSHQNHNHIRKRHVHHRRGSTSSTDSNPENLHQPNSVISTKKSLHIFILSLALMVFPFIPATNMFFYVGFVIAERVLYIPSMGFCLLVAEGATCLYKNKKIQRGFVIACVCVMVFLYGARTVIRNEDWRTEEQLYKSGIAVNPAKAWGNLANIMNGQNRKQDAETAYKQALKYRSNMADVHYNLGILLQDQKRYEEALQSYEMAIRCRPKLSMAHLNLGIVHGLLGHKDKAEKIYLRCAELDTSSLKDPKAHSNSKISCLYNLGRLYADQNQNKEAVQVYHEAIEKKPTGYAGQSLYNMLGESYAKLGMNNDAEHWYRQALEIKPDHIPAHLTLAKLMQAKGKLVEAEELFIKANKFNPKDESVYQHYGQFLTETGRNSEAADQYLLAVNLLPTDFELVSNTANVLRQAGFNEKAEHYYRRATELGPNVVTSHMNLGAMYHFNGKLEEAEKSYLQALRLKPDDQVTTENLRKLRNLLHRNGNGSR